MGEFFLCPDCEFSGREREKLRLQLPDLRLSVMQTTDVEPVSDGIVRVKRQVM